MGRLDQFKKRQPNPAETTIEWAGSGTDGFLKAYDKEAGKIQINELTFVVLEQRHCVDGYYGKENTGAWSNEVRDLNEPLVVRWKKDDRGGEIANGLYADIKDELKTMGIKYHKSIYAMVVESDVVEPNTVVRIRFKGAASFEWSTFCKDNNISGGVKITGYNDKQNGAIKFRTPIFEATDIDAGAMEEAEMAYVQVDSYFKETPAVAVEAVPEPDESDALPF